jgi:indoleamine 2,3-dioxygenase
MSQYFYNQYSDGFFHINSKNGFLPICDPLKTLPNKYYHLQELINTLHVFQENNIKGVLAVPNMIEERISLIPNYVEDIKNEDDIFILQALYRAYTFITSGYTLELSYQEFIKSGNYGKARQLLPANIAIPLVEVSNKLQAYPWLDYHYAYSIGNYVKKDPNGTLDWKNLDMACKFTGGSDEVGFIMLHVYINELSPMLVGAVMDYGANHFVKDLQVCGEVMTEINSRRRQMWEASRHDHYNDFRIFIMGIKGNDSIFGDGLIYEGCFDNIPQQFRGQTGAQDSIIPMIDIFTGVVDYYPDNKLTEYLLDLRTYRPVCIQNFFKDLREYYVANPIYKFLCDTNNIIGLVFLLKIVDEVYLFRNGHWQFVQKYIMSNTKYAFATGGTPITTWLINQIEAVLKYEEVIINYIKTNCNDSELLNCSDMWNKLSNSYNSKKQLLYDQVNELNNINYDIKMVYNMNTNMNLDDTKL